MALALVASDPAQAHRLNVFATAEGAVITGYAYFAGGGRAGGAVVELRTVDGRLIARTAADIAGDFAFTATERTDHQVLADVGDGHRAGFPIAAEELPATLPETARQPQTRAPADVPVDLASTVEQAVARQIRPLREDLDTYRAEIRWRDAVGGIGYILGLAGIGFFLLGRRRKGE